MKIAGFGSENLVKVAVDTSLAMDPLDLEQKIQADSVVGLSPCCVVATVGSTSSTAIDPLAPIGRLCEEHDLWLHVDAALAGSAAILPEMRWLLDGVESCHSLVFNPHKWMFVNFDCSAFFCREPEVLIRTMTIDPEYLKTDRDRQVTNYRDWGIQLGRRFRSLKLWFVLRYYGVEGLQQMLREHLELAREFKGWVTDSPDFELLAPVPLQTVCFRFNPGDRDEAQLDAMNKSLMDAVNRSGKIFITHTRLHGKFTLRLSVGQIGTRRVHLEQAWQALTEESKRI